MATKKGVSPVMLIIVILVLVVLSIVIISSIQANIAKRTKAATESATFGKARQAYLIQTRDLPDLKLDKFTSFGVGQPYCEHSKSTITIQATIANFGEAAAVAPDENEGIPICADEVKGIKYNVNNHEYNLEELKFLPKDRQTFKELEANTRNSGPFEFFMADVHRKTNTMNCPQSFTFTPSIDCANEIEELNDDNNGIPRKVCVGVTGQCDANNCKYICSDVTAQQASQVINV